MLNEVALTRLVQMKREDNAAKERKIKLYNEAIELHICPGCGTHNSLREYVIPMHRSVKCTVCTFEAQYHSTQLRYTVFKQE